MSNKKSLEISSHLGSLFRKKEEILLPEKIVVWISKLKKRIFDMPEMIIRNFGLNELLQKLNANILIIPEYFHNDTGISLTNQMTNLNDEI